MTLDRQPTLTGTLVHVRPLRERDLEARAVEKLGAVRVGREVDAQGRGENHVFRLTAVQWISRAGPGGRAGG